MSPPSNVVDKQFRTSGNRSFQYGGVAQSQDIANYAGPNMIRNPSYGGMKSSLMANGNAILNNSGTNFYNNNPNQLEYKKAEVLDEISGMRNKYLASGGNDPNFLKNLENMEMFYKNLKSPNNNMIPEEIKKLIEAKEEENKRLKEQLELLKMRDEKAETPGNFALGDINLRLNGLNPNNQNMFNIYQNTKEFFLQNEVRSVDLDDEERVLVSLVAQEADALRMLSQLPVGTELYRFKMEQFKELSTTRAEIEKIVQEQRLQKLRRAFEKKRREEDRKFENERWVDEQRKNILANRLRRDLQTNKVEQKYDPTEGFIIHWDYCLGIPKRNDSCQLVYGIYINGDEVYAPRLIDPHPCEIDTSITNRCIFGESHHIMDIPANSNALLIFEIQIFPNKDNPQPKLVSYGWTQLDLFDARRELRYNNCN